MGKSGEGAVYSVWAGEREERYTICEMEREVNGIWYVRRGGKGTAWSVRWKERGTVNSMRSRTASFSSVPTFNLLPPPPPPLMLLL